MEHCQCHWSCTGAAAEMHVRFWESSTVCDVENADLPITVYCPAAMDTAGPRTLTDPLSSGRVVGEREVFRLRPPVDARWVIEHLARARLQLFRAQTWRGSRMRVRHLQLRRRRNAGAQVRFMMRVGAQTDRAVRGIDADYDSGDGVAGLEDAPHVRHIYPRDL